MNINYKESQIDFLSHVSGQSQGPAAPRYMAAQVSLSLENLVIFSIVAIMVVIFAFSLGIERGKGVAFNGAAVPAAENRKQSAAVVDAVPPAGKTVAKEIDVPGKAGVVVLPAVAKVKARILAQPQAVQAKASPAKMSVASSAKGAYTIQIASYKGIKSAQREADRLKQKGYDQVYVLPSGQHIIVCVGNFKNKEEASGTKKKLNNSYQGSVVRRL